MELPTAKPRVDRALIDRYLAAAEKVRAAEDDLTGWKSERWEAERDLIRAAKDAGLKAGARLDEKSDPCSMKLEDRWIVKYTPDDWGKVLQWACDNCPESVQRQMNARMILSHIDAGKPLPSCLSVEAFAALSVRRKPRRIE